ncbi:MAG: glycosyltransferase [Actinobacteria bacterium]|nr:glycosyltransferase [Actinomycetota bacterium]
MKPYSGPVLPGEILFFGQLRRYKGVVNLTTVISQSVLTRKLTIAGAPSDAAIASEITASVRTRPEQSVSLHLRFMSEDELAGHLHRCELVVLPYERVDNSGSVLMALSMCRPVLVPRIPVFERLATEVGPNWVLMYSGALTGVVLDDALRTVRSAGKVQGPLLDRRSWQTTGIEHAQVFASAASMRS